MILYYSNAGICNLVAAPAHHNGPCGHTNDLTEEEDYERGD